MIFACAYEEWSGQYEYDVQTNYNPPGRHWAGDDRGDQLSPVAGSEVGRATGCLADVISQSGDSFRWRPEGDEEHAWLTRQYAATERQPVRLHLGRPAGTAVKAPRPGPSILVADR